MFDVSPISKAIAGGLVAAAVGLVARYGFNPSPEVLNAVSVLITAVVSYAFGHAVVWLSPANKVK